METDVLLCDHAEAVNGKLFINGAGINVFWVAAKPPHSIRATIAMVIHVPYTATNQPHVVTVDLVDEDGNPVVPWAPEGAQQRPAVRLQANFNVGRPAKLSPGEEQTFPLALGFQVPFADLGRYAFRVAIDDEHARSLPFRLDVRSQ